MADYEKPFCNGEVSAMKLSLLAKRGLRYGRSSSFRRPSSHFKPHQPSIPPMKMGTKPSLRTGTTFKRAAMGGAALGILGAAVPFGILTGTHVAESDKKRTECKEDCKREQKNADCYRECEELYPEESMVCKMVPCPSSHMVDNFVKIFQFIVLLVLAAFIMRFVGFIVSRARQARPS
jgi:hypothetical protein